VTIIEHVGGIKNLPVILEIIVLLRVNLDSIGLQFA
jgi:hypothetical protein